MQQYEMAKVAITEKARSERLYMAFALTLAVFLAIAGSTLVILGIGDHLDIVVQGTGDLEARFINASPGVALWLISAAVFFFAKPRRLEADASHVGSHRLRFGAAGSKPNSQYAENATENISLAFESWLEETKMSPEALAEIKAHESSIRHEGRIVMAAVEADLRKSDEGKAEE